jgi:curved DNA-binding protein CbpA
MDSTRPSDPAPSSVRTLRSVTPEPGQDRGSVLPSITMPTEQPTPVPSVDRSSIPPTTDVVLLEISERAEKADAQNYYQLLGVGQGTPNPQISAAFFKLAKRFHPDRLGIEDPEVKAQAVSLFARMNEAHQVLTDNERRAEYDEELNEGAGTAEEQAQVQAVVRAITEFQKAEVFFKKGQMDLAEASAKSAMQDDPEQADYVALYASVAAQRRGNGRMDDLIDLLDGAIRRDPKAERARFARGQIYKRMNRNDLAIKDFRWVAEQNPRNLEATREVRLYNMRQGGPASQRPSTGPKSSKSSKSSKEGSSGFFGKFFKR